MSVLPPERLVASPRQILFVPVSGPGGSGEYFRCLAIAQGLAQRWPKASVHFVLHRGAAYAKTCPYPCTLIEDSPTRDVAAVLAFIEQLLPDVVIFDSAGRHSQFKAVAQAGSVCIYISSRRKTRWKGFRWDRMPFIDEHWLAAPAFLAKPLTLWERMKMRLVPTYSVRFLPTFFQAPSPTQSEATLTRLNLRAGEYALLCPGGSGQFDGLANGPLVFGDAAAALAKRQPLPVLMVGAPDGTSWPGVIACGALPNAELMALVAQARVSVVNGGSLLIQALAQQAVCVAVPIAADQAARIAGCRQHGLCVAAAFTSQSIVEQAQALLSDSARRTALSQAVSSKRIANGVSVAVEAIEQRLARRANKAIQPSSGEK